MSSDTPGSAPSLVSPEFLKNPYPAYAWLRQHAPVYDSKEWGGVVLTRYADVMAGLRDPQLSSNRASYHTKVLAPAVQEKLEPLLHSINSWLVYLDPPDHGRIRKLVSRAFLPRLIEAMRPRIEALSSQLISELLASADGSLDIVKGLAVPLPILAFGAILGLPPKDGMLLKGWAEALLGFLGARQSAVTLAEPALRAATEMDAYFRALFTERRKNPPAELDLLTELLNAEEGGIFLNEQELLSTCTFLLIGGYQTTAGLIGSALWMLAQREAATQYLRQNPAAIPAAVSEAMRLESPIQRQARMPTRDFELHGQRIEKGRPVFLVMAAANRDPQQFPRPDSFELTRGENRHLSFGHGPHYCVGAALGQLEVQCAIAAVLRALPKLSLADDNPAWVDNLTMRGLKHLRLLTA